MKRIKILLCVCATIFSINTQAEDIKLLNVSYDPTREFYQEFNVLFSSHWHKTTGQKVDILQSHGGSGKQARSVIDGLEADVVTLALAYDIDQLFENGGLIASNWQSRLPYDSSPYTSTIVFLVHKENPKNIKDWGDLTRSDIKVITPNPKTSGGARWNILAAWGYAIQKFNKDESKAKEFIRGILKNVPVFDTGARGSTNTFVQRQIGDVLIVWESEALFVLNQESNKQNKVKLEIVYPSVSILAEPPVAVVDKVVEKKGTKIVAEEYLKFLYTEEAQELITKYYFRPRLESIFKKHQNQFPRVSLFTINELCQGWKAAHEKFFRDGGLIDNVYEEIGAS